jgi:CRISPR-associated endonuclease/helicase Cas3
VPYSLQRHELLDFFDTDANLSLGFTDVSPFVRGTDAETDFYVLWRDWDGSKPDHYPDYQRQEICPVSIGKAKSAMALLNKGWLWRGKETDWIGVRDIGVVPGMTILLPSNAGGYSIDKGWTGSDADKPVSDLYEPRNGMPDEEMLSCLKNGWRSIAVHTEEVKTVFSEIIKTLSDDLFTETERSSVERGIDWHDVGKNHHDWQQAAMDALAKGEVTFSLDHLPLAKFSLSESLTLKGYTGRDLKERINDLRHSFKPGLAHEVASALAFRQHEQAIHGTERRIESLLAEYLIMSHHGHVRKVLRDELPKNPTASKDTDTVRGICNGDKLPAVPIGDEFLGCTSLSTDCRRMGRDEEGHESYTRGVLRLLEHYGPFRLAFFEALFRVADIQASILAQNPSNA